MRWRRILPGCALFYLVAIVFATWGFLAANNRIFPYYLLYGPISEAQAFLKGGEGENKSLKEKLTTGLQERENRFDYGSYIVREPDFRDEGYLLIPRFSRKYNQVIVELFRLSDGTVLHTWLPPVEDIVQQGKAGDSIGINVDARTFRVQHPFLLPDGSIVFSHGEGYMARIDKDSRIMWVHSGHFHHAIEMDHTGHLIVNINILPPSIDPGFTIRDDGFARMTIDGEIVEEWSLLKILQENGMAARVLGQGRIVPRDLLHLNDAQPVLEDVGILRQGDFILSIRELSAVLIYRPETDKIVKMQTGPWMRQHDVDVLPDGRISVFNNDVIVKAGGRYTRNRPMSSVGIWNPQTGQYEEPWNAVFEAIEMHTKGGGLARILPNGDVFVEEPLRNRMLRVSPQAVRWEYVNADPEKPDISGAIHWARYFLPEEVNLEWLQ